MALLPEFVAAMSRAGRASMEKISMDMKWHLSRVD
jgi:hypothetical protein